MTVSRFWRFWGLILLLEAWLILSLNEPQAPVLVRPRVLPSFPELPTLPVHAEMGPNTPHSNDVAELMISRMWGETAQALSANQPFKKPNWALVGVYGRGSAKRVIVRFEEDRQPVQELKAGDPLPSGDVIAAIESQRVCVLVGKQMKRRWLPINAIGELVY